MSNDNRSCIIHCLAWQTCSNHHPPSLAHIITALLSCTGCRLDSIGLGQLQRRNLHGQLPCKGGCGGSIGAQPIPQVVRGPLYDGCALLGCL